MRIAVDAMGGDHAPAEIVRGAAAAAVEYGIDISLVGLPAAVQPLLDSHPRLQLVPCTQAIAMDEHPAQAVRSKPDSSMAVCARLCKEGRADGWTSAGNSGAIMAAALLIQGRIRGVERPALGSIVPTQNGFAYFLDVGANVDSKPEYMVQFAAMGAVYAREMLGRAEPHCSFAGLKTAVRHQAQALVPLREQDVADLCAAFETAAADSVSDRVRRAMEIADAQLDTISGKHLVVAGGVAANRRLREALTTVAAGAGYELHVPPPALCTDNAAMVAWAGAERLARGWTDSLDIAARARWPLDPEATPALGFGRLGAKA